jgi:hypothetical protein
MKNKNKIKRFGIILLEFAFLIVIFLGIVVMKANATNGPELNRWWASSDLSKENLSIENDNQNLNAESFIFQRPDKSLLEETRNTKENTNADLSKTLLNTYLKKRLHQRKKDLNTLVSLRNTLSQISTTSKSEIYSDQTLLNSVMSKRMAHLKPNKTRYEQDIIRTILKLSGGDLNSLEEYSDSIPKISEAIYHKNLAPQILIDIN